MQQSMKLVALPSIFPIRSLLTLYMGHFSGKRKYRKVQIAWNILNIFNTLTVIAMKLSVVNIASFMGDGIVRQ